jgi:hypothetical protein
MAMDVIFTTTEQGWFRWAGQYVKRQSTGRRAVSIPPGTGAKAARDAIINALNTAGAGGRLVMNVGHGSFIAGQPADGLCELAPGGMLVLVGRNVQPHNPRPGATIVNVFYDVPAFPGQPSDLGHDTKNNPSSQRLKDWALYQDIGKAMRRMKPSRIVLLTCRVGSATEFLRKIANDWGVVIGAYTRRVACTEDTYSQPGQRSVTTSYVHLEGEVYPKSSSGGADDNVIASEELPYRPSQSVWIGPPLPKP